MNYGAFKLWLFGDNCLEHSISIIFQTIYIINLKTLNSKFISGRKLAVQR